VQELLGSNVIKCKVKFSQSGALLQGKLFDDKGNRMGPTFSSKNGVRYRFYVSAALRGRKHKAGSLTRIAAGEIEGIVEKTICETFKVSDATAEMISDSVERIVLSDSSVCITFKPSAQEGVPSNSISIPWTPSAHRQEDRARDRRRLAPAAQHGRSSFLWWLSGL
jgi:hypothetical protein